MILLYNFLQTYVMFLVFLFLFFVTNKIRKKENYHKSYQQKDIQII